MAAAKKLRGRGLGNLISSGAPQKQDAGDRSPASRKQPKKVTIKPHRPDRGPALEPADDAKPASADAMPVGNYREVTVAKIVPSPYQPRRDIDAEQIRELAESIRSEGLLQPIVVREAEEGGYELIAGERRWRAHQYLGIKQITARIMSASDASAAVISMIENLQREGLNPVDEALGYASLMSDFDLTQESVAERVGKARASIANALRLLQLDREIQGYLAKGMLSVGHAKVLLGVSDPAQRALLARRVIESGLSVRELERAARQTKAETDPRSKAPRAPNADSTVVLSLEKELSSRLNTKVQLKHTPKKGRIIIEYYGNDDLQRILEKTGLQ